MRSAAWTRAGGNCSTTAPSPPTCAPKPLSARPISQAHSATRIVCRGLGIAMNIFLQPGCINHSAS